LGDFSDNFRNIKFEPVVQIPQKIYRAAKRKISGSGKLRENLSCKMIDFLFRESFRDESLQSSPRVTSLFLLRRRFVRKERRAPLVRTPADFRILLRDQVYQKEEDHGYKAYRHLPTLIAYLVQEFKIRDGTHLLQAKPQDSHVTRIAVQLYNQTWVNVCTFCSPGLPLFGALGLAVKFETQQEFLLMIYH
jgi:hypothetical protein